jgi:hypothetical protein
MTEITTKRVRWGWRISGILLLAVVVCGTWVAWRAKRDYEVLKGWRQQVRSLIQSGETIGSKPASQTFEPSYLEAVFGDEPGLVTALQEIITKGLKEDSSLNLGEVSAMIVTYRKGPDGTVSNVAAHVLGGFAVAKRRPGMNRDGFFAAQIDPAVWNTANTTLSLLGRDYVIFADPNTGNDQEKLRVAMTGGNIMPLVEAIREQEIYYRIVFPEPKRVMPTQLRAHVQACVVRGMLAPYKGRSEVQILSRDDKSAVFTAGILSDFRLASLLALRGRFDGIVHQTDWGNHVSSWWAVEMAQTLDRSSLTASNSLVTFNADYERRMVNVVLKSLERMGRDMSQMSKVRDDRLDPRLADAAMQSTSPLHYWSSEHRWGPDWHIGVPTTNKAAPDVSVPVAAPANPSAKQT